MRVNNRKVLTGFAKASISIEFSALRQHCELVASMIDAEKTKLAKEINKLISSSDQETSDYDDHLSDQHWMIHEVLPRLQWQSQLLTIYASFEHMLHEICDTVKSKIKSQLSFRDLGGQGIHRARNYLVKIGEIEQPFKTKGWQRAALIGEIRNVIAHRRGEIDLKAHQTLSERLEKEEHIELRKLHEDSTEAQIIFDHNFIKETIRDLNAFISSIANFELPLKTAD
jgi:hypothetical protein